VKYKVFCYSRELKNLSIPYSNAGTDVVFSTSVFPYSISNQLFNDNPAVSGYQDPWCAAIDALGSVGVKYRFHPWQRFHHC